MKVLVSKYEIRAIQEYYPDFEACPDFVEVGALVPAIAGLTPVERTSLADGIEAALSKQAKRKAKAKR
jgi:hypothetical protein